LSDENAITGNHNDSQEHARLAFAAPRACHVLLLSRRALAAARSSKEAISSKGASLGMKIASARQWRGKSGDELDQIGLASDTGFFKQPTEVGFDSGDRNT
jgi:hypothetical protein